MPPSAMPWRRGAAWAESAAALASGSEAILICVGYDRELRDLVSAETC